MSRKDERGVTIPAPLQFNSAETASAARYDDEHRGPAVLESYELSHCRIDLGGQSAEWSLSSSLPPRLIELAKTIPEAQRADWLRRQVNLEESDRLIASAMQSGDLPIWVAPIGELERLIAPSALVEVDRATVVSGVYRPPNDRGWLSGRPLFVKKDDWAHFVAKVQTDKKGSAEPIMIVMPLPDEWGSEGCRELPFWLNMYQLVAWVQYRDLSVVAKASDWMGLAGQHFYGLEPKVGQVVELERALQGKKLTAQGAKKSGGFEPIPSVEWTRMRIAPLDGTTHHPYVHIQVDRDDVLKLFPPKGACGDDAHEADTNRDLSSKRRKNPGPVPDADWPAAIESVTADCISAGYVRPLIRGRKSAIQTMLLSAMEAKNKYYSDDTARKYATEVIARLPDSSKL